MMMQSKEMLGGGGGGSEDSHQRAKAAGSLCCGKCTLFDVAPWVSDFLLYFFSVLIGALGMAQYAEKTITPHNGWIALWFFATLSAVTAAGFSKAFSKAVKQVEKENIPTSGAFVRVQMNMRATLFAETDEKLSSAQSNGFSVTRYTRYTLMALVFGIGLATGLYVIAATPDAFKDDIDKNPPDPGMLTTYQYRWYSGFIVLAILQFAVNLLPVAATVLAVVLVTH